MKTVTLINPFEVSAAQEEDFLSSWEQIAQFLSRQVGHVTTELQTELSPGARFRYTAVTVWRSAEAFWRAIRSQEFGALVGQTPIAHYPSLYEPFLAGALLAGPNPLRGDRRASAHLARF